MSADKPPSYEEATGSAVGSHGRDFAALPSGSNGTEALAQPCAGRSFPPASLGQDVAKEKEALASFSGAAHEACGAQAIGDEVYPKLKDEKEQLAAMVQPQVPAFAPAPGALKPLVHCNKFYIRETLVASHRGGVRRNAVVVSRDGDAEERLLQVQRGPRGPSRHVRALEVLDGAGGSVVGAVESTKRSAVLSVEMQCPPGCRVSRVEVGPGEGTSLLATLLAADETPVMKAALPPMGQLQRQPLLKLEGAKDGGDLGKLQWSWSTEADLLQAEVQLCGPVDARLKAAIVALCLLAMEAFSKRWSSSSRGGRGGRAHRGSHHLSGRRHHRH